MTKKYLWVNLFTAKINSVFCCVSVKFFIVRIIELFTLNLLLIYFLGVKMENDARLMIRDEFQRGSTKEEAFKNISGKRDLNPLSYPTICDWLKRIHDNDLTLKDEIGERHYNLLRSIISQYTKFAHALYRRTDIHWAYGREAIILGRFNLITDEATNSIEIYDSFNEELRYVFKYFFKLLSF